MRSADDAQLECESDRFRAAIRAEFYESAFEMPIYRPFTDAKRSRNFLRGLSERDVP
jgi:hypothetical protein